METIDLTALMERTREQGLDSFDAWMDWMLFALISDGRKLEGWIDKDANGKTKLLVEMKINGEFVSLSKVVERQYTHFERCVNERAEQIVKERYDERYKRALSAVEGIGDRLRDRLETFWAEQIDRDDK